MVINLNEYRQAKALARQAAMEQQYLSEERLCVNCTPPARVLAMLGYEHPHAQSPELPDDLADVDVDAFIEHVQTLATQI
jgi:hypothetical protein